MARTEKFKPEQIIEAIQKHKGMVFLAARALNCHPETIREYAKKYKEVQAALESERGAMVDTAELALWKAIQSGEGWAVCFALKTLGKERGFVEKSEIDHTSGGKPIQINLVEVIKPGKFNEE